jgi:putative flippase GtrA
MISLARRLLNLARTPTGRKAVKYSTVSLISIAVAQTVLFLTFGVGRIATAMECNVIATAVATIPSYNLNRRWAWGKAGKSHLWKEVVPFWTISFIGLTFSTGMAGLGEHIAGSADLPHLWASAVVNQFSLTAYGILWVGKFIVFNKLLFVDRGVAVAVEGDDFPDGRGDRIGLTRQSA